MPARPRPPPFFLFFLLFFGWCRARFCPRSRARAGEQQLLNAWPRRGQGHGQALRGFEAYVQGGLLLARDKAPLVRTPRRRVGLWWRATRLSKRRRHEPSRGARVRHGALDVRVSHSGASGPRGPPRRPRRKHHPAHRRTVVTTTPFSSDRLAGIAAQTPAMRSGVPNVDNLALRYMLANTMIRLEQITFAVRKSQILHREEPRARRRRPACIFTTRPRARPVPGQN